MKIKIAFLKDYQEYITALAYWSFNTWAPYYPNATRKSQIEKFKQHCNTDTLPLTLLALNLNDHLLGMCSLRLSEDICPHLSPWLSALYVTPGYRHHNIGEQLMDAAKQHAKEKGFHSLYSINFKPELNNYCANLGWESISEDTLNGHTVSIMTIKLT